MMNDNMSLSHTKWNCRYHIHRLCGRIHFESNERSNQAPENFITIYLFEGVASLWTVLQGESSGHTTLNEAPQSQDNYPYLSCFSSFLHVQCLPRKRFKLILSLVYCHFNTPNLFLVYVVLQPTLILVAELFDGICSEAAVFSVFDVQASSFNRLFKTSASVLVED